MQQKKQFAERLWPSAVKVTAGTGLFPETLVSQASLETGYGSSRLAKPDINNFFGIKARKTWPGKIASFTTKEEINGKVVTIKGTGLIYQNYATAIADKADPETFFRVYATDADGLKNWVQFLQINKRYTRAGVFSAKTPAEQFEALKRAGYATDSRYVDKLLSILSEIKKFNLEAIKSAAPVLALVPLLLFAFYLISKK